MTAMLLVFALSGFAQTAPSKSQPEPKPQAAAPAKIDPADPKWLDRMSKDDRTALDEALGYAPPPLSSNLKWIGGNPMTWDELRGRVIVIQSWSVGNASSRNWPQRVADLLKQHANPSDLAIIALHTPEDADRAEDYLKRKAAPVPVVLDSTGEFCDALGVYREPVNIIIDRNRVIRYAGLNPGGLKQAVANLIAESHDPAAEAPVRPADAKPSASAAAFPPCTVSPQARDMCGQAAPEFYVDEWMTPMPNARGKVVVLDFWATWCRPCVASIPHMNQLARAFGNDAVFVGISGEKQFDFERGLDKANLKLENFAYSLALDPEQRMSRAIQVRGIPYCIVMSSDWVVRWQGNPSSLNSQVLKQIIEADRAAQQHGSANKDSPPRRRGWTTAR